MGLLFDQGFWVERLDLLHSGSRINRHKDRTYRAKLACEALSRLLLDPGLEANIAKLEKVWHPFHHGQACDYERDSAGLVLRFSKEFLHHEERLLRDMGVSAPAANRVTRAMRRLQGDEASPMRDFKKKVQLVQFLACSGTKERFGPVPPSKRAVRGASGVATMALNGIAAVKLVFLPSDIKSHLVSRSLEAGGQMLVAALKGRY